MNKNELLKKYGMSNYTPRQIIETASQTFTKHLHGIFYLDRGVNKINETKLYDFYQQLGPIEFNVAYIFQCCSTNTNIYNMLDLNMLRSSINKIDYTLQALTIGHIKHVVINIDKPKMYLTNYPLNIKLKHLAAWYYNIQHIIECDIRWLQNITKI